jgi:5-deoxy-glucuronate isomerase
MKPLLYRSSAARTRDLTPRALGWSSIHFGVRRMAGREVWAPRPAREERCLVLLRGAFEIVWERTTSRRAGRLPTGRPEMVGPRADVFSAYPHAVYLPADTAFRLVAITECELADCRARVLKTAAGGHFEPRVIGPQACGFEIRGGGNATRQIVDIMPPGFPADRLMICEVFTPAGNWSSYPPHKHDVDAPPTEVDLDEIYYYRFKDPDGYGFQRLYTQRRDDTLRVTHGDVVAVREGYHPFVTAYGYDAYYLNVLAGSRRSMAASDDPRHARFRQEWPAPDPRVPVVPPPRNLHTVEGGIS